MVQVSVGQMNLHPALLLGSSDLIRVIKIVFVFTDVSVMTPSVLLHSGECVRICGGEVIHLGVTAHVPSDDGEGLTAGLLRGEAVCVDPHADAFLKVVVYSLLLNVGSMLTLFLLAFSI